MALILAIEPDRRQVLKLAMLARNYLNTELVVTDTIGRALAMLDERLPDVILTSFQLQPKHRAALMDRLLEVDADGTRVQTLVIPAMGTPGCRPSRQRGMAAQPLGPRGNHGVADGCDPVVFGRQIAECLGRVTADRRSAPVTKWAPPQGFAAATEPASSSLARPEWRELLSTMRRDLDQMQAEQERASAARFVNLDAFRDTGKAPVKRPA
jgi:hypothetical protein